MSGPGTVSRLRRTPIPLPQDTRTSDGFERDLPAIGGRNPPVSSFRGKPPRACRLWHRPNGVSAWRVALDSQEPRMLINPQERERPVPVFEEFRISRSRWECTYEHRHEHRVFYRRSAQHYWPRTLPTERLSASRMDVPASAPAGL